jgi:hypothetical protein
MNGQSSLRPPPLLPSPPNPPKCQCVTSPSLKALPPLSPSSPSSLLYYATTRAPHILAIVQSTLTMSDHGAANGLTLIRGTNRRGGICYDYRNLIYKDVFYLYLIFTNRKEKATCVRVRWLE